MSEANARIIIDKLLREADWVLPGDEGVVNVGADYYGRFDFQKETARAFGHIHWSIRLDGWE